MMIVHVRRSTAGKRKRIYVNDEKKKQLYRMLAKQNGVFSPTIYEDDRQ